MAFLSFLGRRVISLEGEYIGVVTDLERNPLTGDGNVVIRVEVPDSQVEFLKLVPKDFRVEEDFLRLKRRVKILKRGSSLPKVVGSVPTVPEFPKEEQPKKIERPLTTTTIPEPALPTTPEISKEKQTKKIERPLPTTTPEPTLPTIPKPTLPIVSEVSKEEQPKKIERPLPPAIPEIPKPSLDLPSVDLLSDVLPEDRDLKEEKKELKPLASREPEPLKPSVDLLSDVLPEERFRSLEKDKKGLRPLASREKPLVESSERGSVALTESYGLGRKKDGGKVDEKALTDFPFSPTVDSDKEKLCKSCGKSVSSEFAFCPFCASPLNVCRKCGKDLDPDWVACPFCGTVVKNY